MNKSIINNLSIDSTNSINPESIPIINNSNNIPVINKNDLVDLSNNHIINNDNIIETINDKNDIKDKTKTKTIEEMNDNKTETKNETKNETKTDEKEEIKTKENKIEMNDDKNISKDETKIDETKTDKTKINKVKIEMNDDIIKDEIMKDDKIKEIKLDLNKIVFSPKHRNRDDNDYNDDIPIKKQRYNVDVNEIEKKMEILNKEREQRRKMYFVVNKIINFNITNTDKIFKKMYEFMNLCEQAQELNINNYTRLDLKIFDNLIDIILKGYYSATVNGETYKFYWSIINEFITRVKILYKNPRNADITEWSIDFGIILKKVCTDYNGKKIFKHCILKFLDNTKYIDGWSKESKDNFYKWAFH